MALLDRTQKNTFFGLPIAPDVTRLNVATYLLGCLASVMFLVFLNTSQVSPAASILKSSPSSSQIFSESRKLAI